MAKNPTPAIVSSIKNTTSGMTKEEAVNILTRIAHKSEDEDPATAVNAIKLLDSFNHWSDDGLAGAEADKYSGLLDKAMSYAPPQE